MARQSGKRPAPLDGPELPPDLEHVWEWFLELHAARGSNGMGPNPIGFGDMQAWIALTGTIVRPAEIQAIRALDRIWLSELEKDEGGRP